MPNTYAEPTHAGAFLVSEASWTRSREEVTILAGSGAERALTAGMVLGARVSGTAASAAYGVGGGVNTGDGAMGAVTVTGPAKDGVYTLTITEAATNAGTFRLEDPDGDLVATGTVAVAFSAGGLAFTLADGATDFVAGDGFKITVTQTALKYLQWNEDGTLGEQVAAGVLIDDVTAPDGVDAKAAAIVRDAEVNASEIVWTSTATAAEKADATQELAKLGIIAR
jgi:hypothetical protein